MSDVSRIVERPGLGRRPTVLADLEQGAEGVYKKERGSFKVTAPPKRGRQASGPGRYAGSWTVGEQQDNGTIAFKLLVNGADADTAVANANALVELCEASRQRRRYFEWRPDGTTRSGFYEIRGPATWDLDYQWDQFNGTRSMMIAVQIPVGPLVEWDECDFWEDFAIGALSEYTFDAGVASDVAVAGGALTAVANLAAEKRLIHTARGYDYGDQQWTAKFTPGTTITGFKGAAEVKRISATTYLEVYVDDDGTNSRLRLDKVVGGARTNLATANLAARISNGTAFWVRGRVEGDIVYREYFTSEPTPTAAPTLAPAGHTLAGGDQTTFGKDAVGKGGAAWIPQHAAATLDDLQGHPWTYRNRTLPEKINLRGKVPGRAAALCELDIGLPSGAGADPIWAMFAWARRGAGAGASPFAIFEAEALNISGWTVISDAAARGGSKLQAAANAGGSARAWVTVNPKLLVDADEFRDGELDLEVWGRYKLNGDFLSPRATVFADPTDLGASFGAQRFSHEWGRVGRALILPASGDAWRPTRLGTLTVGLDGASWRIEVETTWTVDGSSAAKIDLDYLWVVRSDSRILSPTGIPAGDSYPAFMGATSNEFRKRVRPDLSATAQFPPGDAWFRHSGLGGELLELPPGDVDMLAKLSTRVPDEPFEAGDSAGEELAHAATVHMAVTPRSFIARG